VGFLIFKQCRQCGETMIMSTKKYRVPIWFSEEDRFEENLAAVPPRGRVEHELENLKARLLRDLLAETSNPVLGEALRRAVNEAATLAWMTPFPLLVLPALAEEKARSARLQAQRQYVIRERSRTLLPQAA
jgi:hypothetical protein